MLTIEECRSILNIPELDDNRITEIRDYLSSLCKELVQQSIEEYENSIGKTNNSK